MKTVRTGSVDKLSLRLVETNKRFVGLIFSGTVEKFRLEGDAADDLWRQLHDQAARLNPKYVGFSGARQRFLHFFPNAFQSDGYSEKERNYKLAAKKKLDGTVSLEQAETGSGFGESILAVFRASNLLSPFEKTRLQDVLRGPTADSFVRGAASFAQGDTKGGLLAMEKALKPNDCAKWTVVTYLPFLWRPEQHMYLKPEVTKDFAARVGHQFSSVYEARLDPLVYLSLLDLVKQTEAELAELSPRDRIDIQSFIWTVGAYSVDVDQPSA